MAGEGTGSRRGGSCWTTLAAACLAVELVSGGSGRGSVWTPTSTVAGLGAGGSAVGGLALATVGDLALATVGLFLFLLFGVLGGSTVVAVAAVIAWV